MISRLTSSDYARLLGRLLPRGPIWRALTGTRLEDINEGSAVELNRVHDRAIDVLDEADPRSADEMLDAWERVAGLPDPDAATPTTTADRQAALHARVTSTGGQSPAYLVARALDHGYTITITEWPYGTTAMVEVTTVEEPLNPGTVMFYFQVDASAALSSDDRERLEALINRLKPAHTIAVFVYS